MSWRIVCISSVSKLDYKMGYLVVRNQEGVKRVHLSEIAVLILESTAISLTAYLLCELNRQKITIIFCDEKRIPYGMLTALYGSHDTSLKYRQQVQWTSASKSFIWAEIVKSKIRGQYSILTDEHTNEKRLLLQYIEQVQPADVTNREGHAAKVYFNALFGMDFSRSQGSFINAALNYGYRILLSVFSREIVSNGYCTQFGIFHNNVFNPLNLACDLMEPFRPLIDRIVSDMKPIQFEHDEKVQLIKKLFQQIQIAGKQQYLINAISIYTKSVLEAVEQGDISLLQFPYYSNDKL